MTSDSTKNDKDRVGILFFAIQDLTTAYNRSLDEDMAIPQDIEDWYKSVIHHWCRMVSEAAINAGVQDLLKYHLDAAEAEIDHMGAFLESYSPFES